MRFLTKNKRICWIILSLLMMIMFFLGSRATFTCAAATLEGPAPRDRPIPAPPLGEKLQQTDQISQKSSDDQNSTLYKGENQGNSGNQGTNQGDNQNNDANNGNQVSALRRNIEVQENKQSLQRSGSDQNSAFYKGVNQGNSGNQGTNDGNNQDNASNSGNQVNNQGNTIGTQINEQGTEVNNNGSTIKHQTNYVNLLPSLRLNTLDGHPLSLGVEKGWYLLFPIRMR